MRRIFRSRMSMAIWLSTKRDKALKHERDFINFTKKKKERKKEEREREREREREKKIPQLGDSDEGFDGFEWLLTGKYKLPVGLSGCLQ